MPSNKQVITFLLFIFIHLNSSAQQSSTFYDPYKAYREALELYDKEKFVAAQEKLSEVDGYIRKNELQLGNEAISLLKINTEYYNALCALELFNNNAESLLLSFVTKYPENSNSKTAYFAIGKFYFRQQKYNEALVWFTKTDRTVLSDKDVIEFDFKNGYCHFEKKNYDEALPYFEKIKNLESKYAYPATYYYALIHFEQKKYDVSLNEFMRLKESKVYATVAPYYIIRIYYNQKLYQELISYSAEALKIQNLKNREDILLFTASAHFNLNEYGKAIPLYEDYGRKASRMNPQATYELGYSYYKLTNYTEAARIMKKLSEEQNLFAQCGLYTLADCFIHNGDKQAARNAFWKASKLNFDTTVSENALFNYAKLSYELRYHQNATDALQEFLKKYPYSPDTDEAKSLLGEVLLSTKNYKDAIVILESITPKPPNASLAYQKVTYYHGVELFNQKQFKEAINLFNKSLSTPIDKSIQAQAHYWKGEAYYNENNITDAIKSYTACIQNPTPAEGTIGNLVNYSIGYAYLKKEDYKSGANYFDKFIKDENQREKPDDRKLNDAILRLADCYFVLKEYDKSLFSYTKIINDHAAGADYALFQKGIILGLQNKQNDKVNTLKTLLNTYTKSTYTDDAYFEIGNSYFVMNSITDALTNFNALISTYPNSRYVSKAKLSLGLIYYNESQDEKALSMYKAIIADYPGSEEAKEALLAIKNIYIDSGNAEGYLSYVKTLSFTSVSSGAQDSISYQAANNRYLLGDCENAISGFNNYIEKFNDGFFITEAHVNRAECYLKNNQEEKALEDLKYLINQNKTNYLERSLLVSARIEFKRKNYSEAANYFVKLEQIAEYKENYGEAIVGAMKCFMFLNSNQEITKYAHKVLAYEKVSAEDANLAHLYLGKMYYAEGKIEDASTEFKIVVKNTKTETGAEAGYMIALILNQKGEYLNSQQACFDLSNQIPSYEYWVAKAFILLADNYFKLGNDFQAKSTLQSIIDEYSTENDDIIPTAKRKLEELTQPKSNTP